MAHLGPEIGGAPPLTETPLYIRDEYDGTTKNLFLKVQWKDLRSHLKYVLSLKGLEFKTRVTSDERLKDIWLGKEAYGNRAKGKRDEVETFNNLEDFIGQPHLLILRLGFLGHKNVAMPGILKEALMLREFHTKPTWVVEEPGIDWSYSYSEDLSSYLEKNFRTITFESKTEEPAPRFTAPVDAEDLSMGGPEEEEPHAPQDIDCGIVGGSEKKRSYSSYGGKKKPSKGPLG